MYTADLAGSKYSPLDQVNATNFSKMEVAWRFKTDIVVGVSGGNYRGEYLSPFGPPGGACPGPM